MKIFLSPHNDDAVLFGSFTILREKENISVVTCFDSFLQPSRGHTFADATTRRKEDLQALSVLHNRVPTFLGIPDNLPKQDFSVELGKKFLDLDNKVKPEVVYAPWPETDGNVQHNCVGIIAKTTFSTVVFYTTYTTKGKSISSNVVSVEDPFWIVKKLYALTCYQSQIKIDNCREHFLRDQREYYEY